MSELTPLSLDDYEAIADAVQETERGRWFLAEYARRNRAADTAQVLEALNGLERRLAAEPNARAAVRLLEKALRRARLARIEGPGDRALGLDEIERDLVLALESLGGAAQRSRDVAPDETPAAAPPPVRALPAPAAVEVEFDWVDLDEFEVQLRDDDAPDIVAVAEIEPGEAPLHPGHPRFVASSVAAPVASGPSAPVRTRPPGADQPGLLDSLTDVEKSILFA